MLQQHWGVLWEQGQMVQVRAQLTLARTEGSLLNSHGGTRGEEDVFQMAASYGAAQQGECLLHQLFLMGVDIWIPHKVENIHVHPAAFSVHIPLQFEVLPRVPG